MVDVVNPDGTITTTDDVTAATVGENKQVGPLTGMSEIRNSLMRWGKSGLMPDTKVIKSYHPATKDSVTGVPIMCPATVYNSSSSTEEQTVTDPVTGIEAIVKVVRRTTGLRLNLDSVPNHPGAHDGAVEDFNVEPPRALFGPKTIQAVQNWRKSGIYLDDIKHFSSNEEYNDKRDKSLETWEKCSADRAVLFLEHGIKRITDTLEDAKNFVHYAENRTTVNTDEEVTASSEERPPPFVWNPKVYEMYPTKVPCAVPGVINCYIEKYDDLDTAPKNYDYTSFVSNQNFVNEDLKEFVLVKNADAVALGAESQEDAILNNTYEYKMLKQDFDKNLLIDTGLNDPQIKSNGTE